MTSLAPIMVVGSSIVVGIYLFLGLSCTRKDLFLGKEKVLVRELSTFSGVY